jgi:hypothetical protein
MKAMILALSIFSFSSASLCNNASNKESFTIPQNSYQIPKCKTDFCCTNSDSEIKKNDSLAIFKLSSAKSFIQSINKRIGRYKSKKLSLSIDPFKLRAKLYYRF